MEFDFNTNILGSAFTGIKHMAWQINESLESLEGSLRLSPAERRNASTARLVAMHINRMCNTVSYLIDANTCVTPEKLESFEIEVLMTDIIRTFEDISSGFAPLSISFESKLKGYNAIMLSKSHFELIILNLLYCCIKTEINRKPAPVKIVVSVTENREHIVFHIRDNNKGLDISTASTLLTEAWLDIAKKDNSPLALTALSLGVAKKSAEELNGRLTATRLQSGNRYDIYLPKEVPVSPYKMCSPARYIPNYSYYHEIFADIKLEHILTKVIESLEGDFEEVKPL